jgi:hypothetical protein
MKYICPLFYFQANSISLAQMLMHNCAYRTNCFPYKVPRQLCVAIWPSSFLTRPFCFSFILCCSMESFWAPMIYALLAVPGNRGSITIELHRVNVRSGGILCRGPKESMHFLRRQAKGAFLEIFLSSFLGRRIQPNCGWGIESI